VTWTEENLAAGWAEELMDPKLSSASRLTKLLVLKMMAQ
jgi:hypothetical protein